jgi:hypothetical protein
MGSVPRMAPRRVLIAAMACVLSAHAVGAPPVLGDGLRLRMAELPRESPVGGSLTVRELVVDGRSLGWKDLVEYQNAFYAPRSMLESLGLAPRRNARSVYTRFESWYALHAIPGVSVQYSLAQRRVALVTGGAANVPAEAPVASVGFGLKPSRKLSGFAALDKAGEPQPGPSAGTPRALAAATPSPTGPIAQAPDAGNPAPGRLLPLEVLVNGAKVGNWLLLEKGGALYATPDAFDEWRLSRDASVPGVPYRDRVWYPLSAVPGYTADFNFAELSVELNFQATAFGATRRSAARASRVAVRASASDARVRATNRWAMIPPTSDSE